MDINDPEYRGMLELSLNRKDEIFVLQSELKAIRLAATKWPRCCDLWQDGLGGMHCQECAQKTFTMLRNIQKILKVDKACNLIEEPCSKSPVLRRKKY